MPPLFAPPAAFIESDDFMSVELDDGDVLVLEPLLVAPPPLFMSVPVDDEVDAPALGALLEPLFDPLCPCASAGAAINPRAATSANAPVNVFIAVPPAAVAV
jgi:hypothetical protein